MSKKKMNHPLSIFLIFMLMFSCIAPLNMGFAEDLIPIDLGGSPIEAPIHVDPINIISDEAPLETETEMMLTSTPASARIVTMGDVYSIVKWDMTAGSTAPMSVAATGGEHQQTPPQLTRDASYVTAPGYSSSSLSTNTWNNGAGVKYWQATFSTKHFQNIKISSSHRSSGTGPRDFQLQYSLDGATFTDVTGGAFVVGNAQPLTKLLNGVALPEAASDCDLVYVRWLVTSNTSAGGTNPIAAGGTSNINSILLTGTEMVTDLTPVANLTSGSVALGTSLSFTNSDPTSTIVYALNNEASYQDYSAETPVVLSALPTTVKVKALSGSEESRTKTFAFQQAKVEPIIPNKFSGKILANSAITFKCASEEALISYIVTKKEGLPEQVIEPETPYTGPIQLSVDMFPVKIEAVAKIDGYISSNPLVLNYTEKVVGIQKLYFGQLHSHTNASDGIGTPAEAFAYAKEAEQIDFLAVTDHSNYLDKSTALGKMDNDALGEFVTGSTTVTKWKDGKEAAKALTDSTFVGIYAYEMTWSGQYGHMNTFNSTGFVSRNDPQYVVPGGAGLKAYYDLLKAYPQTISQFNHPGSTFGDFQNFGYYSPEIDRQISLIEVGNGEGDIRSGGYFPSYDYYQRALDKGWHVAPTNNQDNHKGKWGDANTARTVILTDDFSETGIYAALADMKVYSTEDHNLQIHYTINGEALGTIFDQKPNAIDIKVSVVDPDLNDAIGRVSIIANGGVVVATTLATNNQIDWNITLDPSYSYYYVRVEQADKDIAVTAPIWVGEVTKVGIGSAKSESAMHVVGEAMNIVTNVFNNESSALSVSKIEYIVDDEVVGEQNLQNSIESLTSKDYSFQFTPKRQGKYDMTVKVTAVLNKNDYSFISIIKLDVIKLTDVVNIAIDGAHSNFYVTGNYKDSDLNFTAIAGTKNVRVTRILTEISDDTLKGMSALILSTPERHTFQAYVAKSYTTDELEAIKRFADNGGNIILTSTGERLSGYNSSNFTLTLPENERAATISNSILSAIGATTRFNDDEVVDPMITNADIFRLAMNQYNYTSNSPFLNNVQGKTNENFSFYSGNSLALDPDAIASGKVTPLITGGATTKGVKWAGMATTKTLKPDHITTVPEGSVVALASEKLPGGGFLLASGVTFFSNFEVKVEVDNATTLQNSNYAIVNNVLDQIKPIRPITPIAVVQQAEKFDRFIIQGVVASNASGYDKDTAFFDCIYVQDETGGINLFPVAGNFKIGDTVKVTGLVGEYQGEKQLTVESIEAVDAPSATVTPSDVSTLSSMSPTNLGKLLKVTGKVVSFVADKDMLKEIVIDDGTGNSRVFIDGYITTSISTPSLAINDTISAVGFASVDTNGNRLRVRDRAEIVMISKAISEFSFETQGPIEKFIGDAPFTNTVTDGVGTGPITYSSENPMIATVDAMTGQVTILSTGMTVITATKAASPTHAEAQMTYIINVLTIPVTGMVLDKTSADVLTGTKIQLTATVYPTNATDKTITWTSNNTSVATVDSNGLVTGIASGIATITATSNDGAYTATSSISVITKVIGVTINKTLSILEKGRTTQLIATINPNGATDQSVTWTSTNTKVAIVNANGMIKGIGTGIAVITCKTNDGNFIVKSVVIVKTADMKFFRLSDLKGDLMTLIKNILGEDTQSKIDYISMVNRILGNKMFIMPKDADFINSELTKNTTVDAISKKLIIDVINTLKR
jgi:uncharacterized protein YjdB